MFIALLIALSIREDTALVVIMLGLVLAFMYRPRQRRSPRSDDGAVRRSCWGSAGTSIATRLVIPHFNQGKQPFYIEYFYSNYGKDVPAIVETMLRHPNRVDQRRDAARPIAVLPRPGAAAGWAAVGRDRWPC